jgi:hypothetical protein
LRRLQLTFGNDTASVIHGRRRCDGSGGGGFGHGGGLVGAAAAAATLAVQVGTGRGQLYIQARQGEQHDNKGGFHPGAQYETAEKMVLFVWMCGRLEKCSKSSLYVIMTLDIFPRGGHI